ncbi:flagellar biosynthesis protein FlhF [Lentisalinibacter salinarum]|uniref:flagellar biosynthesis protein FlhF n=1 Tax=Lentisalinibacter salinarum TaxID=2992239 RepID=UPI00386F27B0
MKIKRFVAPDMRQALRRVREEQGPDAVILSNSRVAEGVEIIAALDYDEALVREALGSLRAETGSAAAAAATPTGDAVAEAPAAAVREEERSAGPLVHRALADLADRPAAETPAAETPAAAGASPSLDAVHSDIRELRELLESQLSSLAWNDYSRRRPGRAQVLRNLSRIGVAPDVAAPIAEQLEDGAASEHAWQLPLRILAETLPMAEDRLLENGGIAAFVGPTGVGKTTTIAKLAARYAMRHGAEGIALVTTDCYRIGAEEQLATYARILGARMYVAEDGEALAALLQRLGSMDLVLIDTTGMNQRDVRLADQLAALKIEGTPIEVFLTLSATAQEASLDEAVRRFGQLPLAGCALTKIDEAAQLGCALGVLIRHRLPLVYIADGQSVPQDFYLADAKRLWIATQAVECMRRSEADVSEEVMAQRFGGGADALS